MRETTTLGALCKAGGGGIQTGPFGSQLHASDYVADGIPSVMPQNIGDNALSTDGIARITESDANRLSKYLLAENDIVYSRRGDVEKRSLVRAKNAGWLCGTGCLKVSFGPDPVCDPRYISYYLGTESSRSWIKSHAVGATMPNLNTGILAAVPIEVPSLAEQQVIADVLGALDDKIAANRKLIGIVDELASTEFRELLMSSSVDSRLGEVLRLDYGRALPGPQRQAGNVYVYGSGGLTGTHNEALIDGPGVIVGRKGTVGAVYWSNRPSFPIDTTFYAVPLSQLYPHIFCYFLLKSLSLGENNSDSAVPGLNRAEALSTRISLPEPAAIERFSAGATEMFEMMSAVDNESRTLVTIRDALLPQLMSGELRVRDAEKQVEAVL